MIIWRASKNPQAQAQPPASKSESHASECSRKDPWEVLMCS